MCLIPVQFSKISASLLPKSAVLIYQVSISMSMFFITFFKKRKKGVDGSRGVCYIMTVAPMRAAGERKQAQALERRRMYPENYTMQNS